MPRSGQPQPGRGRELPALFLTLLASAGLIVVGFLLLPLLTLAADAAPSVFLPKLGAALGFLGVAALWRNRLKRYRYGPDLRPLPREKETP